MFGWGKVDRVALKIQPINSNSKTPVRFSTVYPKFADKTKLGQIKVCNYVWYDYKVPNSSRLHIVHNTQINLYLGMGFGLKFVRTLRMKICPKVFGAEK
jgi:hypothetical protein